MKDNRELAFLSKELATICTDCDVEFNLMKPVWIGCLMRTYIKYLKDWNFKNLLSKFQMESVPMETGIEEGFVWVNDLQEADKIFDQIDLKSSHPVGFQIVEENGKVLGASL